MISRRAVQYSCDFLIFGNRANSYPAFSVCALNTLYSQRRYAVIMPCTAQPCISGTCRMCMLEHSPRVHVERVTSEEGVFFHSRKKAGSSNGEADRMELFATFLTEVRQLAAGLQLTWIVDAAMPLSTCRCVQHLCERLMKCGAELPMCGYFCVHRQRGCHSLPLPQWGCATASGRRGQMAHPLSPA